MGVGLDISGRVRDSQVEGFHEYPPATHTHPVTQLTVKNSRGRNLHRLASIITFMQILLKVSYFSNSMTAPGNVFLFSHGWAQII